ncbi:MAG: MBL fold metallo-hydrolase [Eubacteriales bacterium]
MKISFFGGARAQTGSCYLLEVAGQNILIDCGLQQGCDEFNDNGLEFYASRIDQVLLTNAHIDSSGRLPLLVQEGYYGRIVTTPTTKKLMRILLKEVADLRTNEAWWRNQKGQRSGIPPHDPIYSMTDVVVAMQQVETEEFGVKFPVCEGVEARFLPSAHMPGAAIIEIWATEGAETRKIVVSGDLGNKNNSFTGMPSLMEEADFLLMSSDSADKDEEIKEDALQLDEFADVIDMTLAHAGNVIIPVNAVGRVQEVLSALRILKQEKKIKSVPQFKVYLDSFLAEDSVRLFEGDRTTDLGKVDISQIQGENNPFVFDDLVLCKSVEESRALNFDKTPKVILAGSGMCDRGRVQHHLKHNLWRKESTVMMVGHLGDGSFGRRLLEGMRSVQLFGEEVMVRAKILDFRCTSGHADRGQLLSWLGQFKEKPKMIFVVQGHDFVARDFAQHLNACGYTARAPLVKEVYDLLETKVEQEGIEHEVMALSRRGRYSSLPFIRLQDNIRELDIMVKEGRLHTGEEFDAVSRAVREVINIWKKEDK